MNSELWVVNVETNQCQALTRLKPEVRTQLEKGSSVLVHSCSPVYARGIAASLRGLALPVTRETLDGLGLSMREREVSGSRLPVYAAALVFFPPADLRA